MSKAYVIEIGEETAGIVAAEKQGFRFYAAHRSYDPLEGVLFATPRAAEKAARLYCSSQRMSPWGPASAPLATQARTQSI